MKNKDDKISGKPKELERSRKEETEIDYIIKKVESVSLSNIPLKETENSTNKGERRRTQLIDGVYNISTQHGESKPETKSNYSNFKMVDSLNDDTFFSVVPISDSDYGSKEGKNKDGVEPPQKLYKGWCWNSEKKEYYLPSNTGRIRRKMYISPKVYSKLQNHEHQYDGVRWLWDRFRHCEGGILADEMGLGKTVQVCVFLGGLFRSEIASFMFIILPSSLISQWRTELDIWCPKIPKYIYHGSSIVRSNSLNEFYRSKVGGILITTFETFRNDIDTLNSIDMKRIECNYIRNKQGIRVARDEYIVDFNNKKDKLKMPWDIVFIDEAHKLKNNRTQVFNCIQRLKSYSNILCTGTPFQNRITEIWPLIQCVKPNLLGTSINVFKSNYKILIESVRNKSILENEIRSYETAMNHLKNLIRPYVLRRTKKIVSNIYKLRSESNSVNHDEDISKIKKNEIVLWHDISVDQSNAYEDVLGSKLINNILNDDLLPKKNRGSVLLAINLLLKICKHPLFILRTELQTWMYLMKENKCELSTEEYETVSFGEKVDYEGNDYICSVLNLPQLDVELLRKQSVKLQILFILIPRIVNTANKLLVFTESLLMMDLIELTVLIPNNIRWERLEGKQSLEQRTSSLETFRNDEEVKVMLLSKSVGSVGLNLTEANRIIIVEPHWNPTQDDQSIGRAYRIGQKKDVIVYRLITAGTIEDCKFRLQLHKASLAKTFLTGNKQEMFTREEVNYLFSYSKVDNNDIKEALFRFSMSDLHYKAMKEDLSDEVVKELEPYVMAYLDFENIKSE